MRKFPTYLLQTSKGYFFRIRIPTELQHRFKKKEIKKALPTTDKTLALRMCVLYAAQVSEIFQKYEEPAMPKLPYTPNLTVKVYSDFIQYDIDPEHRDEELDSLQQKGILPQAGLPGTQKIITQPTTSDSSLSLPATIQDKPVTATSLILTAAISQYFKAMVETEKRWKPGYVTEQTALFQLLVEGIGDRDITTITREDARDFFEKIQRLPVNRNKDGRLKGRTFEQLVNMEKTTPISTTTANLHMMKFSAFFNWLHREDKVAKNIFIGLQIADDSDPREQKQTFEPADLQNLFTHPYYHGKKPLHAHMYFLPLLGLFTGARAGELAQLCREDIKQETDTWYIDLREENNRQRKALKTVASRRVIPIHSALLSYGFLDFVQSVKKGRLFPQLHERNGRYSHYVTKAFTEHQKEVNFRQEGKSFHSFRHTFIDRLKQLGALENHVAELVGHTVDSETFGRYGKAYAVKNLTPIVEMFDFHAVLPDIEPWTGKWEKTYKNSKTPNELTDIDENNHSTATHSSVFGRTWTKAKES